MADSDFLSRLSDNNSLTDILIDVEDFFDGLDLYVFDNWIDGEICSGPLVSRYWIDVTLMYDYKDMPDPSGAERLVKYGCDVKFTKDKKQVGVHIDNPSDFQPNLKPKMTTVPIWLVEVRIPRRFIDDISDNESKLLKHDMPNNSDKVEANINANAQEVTGDNDVEA